MPLQAFRLDPVGLRGLVVSIEPAIFQDRQRETRDGVLEWNVTLLVRQEGQRPETQSIRVAAAKEPIVPDLAECEPVDPMGRFYTMTGRSGFSVSATGIRQVGSANGSQPQVGASAKASA